MADSDLLTPVVPNDQLNPSFKALVERRSHEPHRDMLRALWREFPNPDGGFVREFQTDHFDRRIWELYVFALGHAGPFTVSRPTHAPDFLFERGDIAIWVEATTANPSPAQPVRPGPKEPDELIAEMNEEIPIRLGSPLYSKLQAKYWEQPHVAGKPLVLAIGDFSQAPGPRHSDFALHRYLYGMDAKVTSLPGEVVRLEHVHVETHSAWKTIPSGFFALPGAEHISAVIFSNEGTLPKFGRMAFDPERYPAVRMWRVGGCLDFDPRATYPKAFGYVVGDAPEDWGHGAYVYHNPNAKHPIPLDVFRGVGGQHWMADGEAHNEFRDFAPLSSVTFTVEAPQGKAFTPAFDSKLRDDVRGKVLWLEEENKKTLQFHAWRDKLLRP
ncbi:MAG: hypothetical protein AB7L91_02440 [Dehalococcoidia bacterium]